MGLGIDIGSTGWKAVHLERALRGWRLVAATRRRAASPSELLPSLHDFFAEPGRRVPSVAGVSGRSTNLQVVLQPAMPPAQYRLMMRYEMDQRKGDADDQYSGFCTLREPDPYFPQFLAMVGIGKRELVDTRVRVLEEAGLDVRDVVPDSFALAAAYRAAHEPEEGTVLLVDIGSTSMELALLRAGRLLFARNVSSGSEIFDAAVRQGTSTDAGKAEAWKVQHGTLSPLPEGDASPAGEIQPYLRTAAGQLVGILQSSLSFARTQIHEKDLVVDRMYLSGGGARLTGLREYLQSALKVPVEPLDPFRGIDLGRCPEEVRPEIERLPSDLAIAVGLAHLSLGGGEIPVLSLAPDRMQKRRLFFEKTLFAYAAAALFALFLGTMTLSAWIGQGREKSALTEFESRNREIRERITVLNDGETALREGTARVEMISAHVTAGGVLLESVARLKRVLPEGVFLRRIVLSPPEQVREEDGLSDFVTFHDPQGRLVHGAVVSSTEEEIRIEGREEAFAVPALRGLLHWSAPRQEIRLTGEIDGSISGGPDAVLDGIVQQLSDPARGVRARRARFDRIPDRPGWRSFEIHLAGTLP